MLRLRDFPLVTQASSTCITGFVTDPKYERDKRVVFYKLCPCEKHRALSEVAEIPYGVFSIFGNNSKFDTCTILLLYDVFGRLQHYAERDEQQFWEVHNVQPLAAEEFDIYPSCQLCFSKPAARDTFMCCLKQMISGTDDDSIVDSLKTVLKQLIVDPVCGVYAYPDSKEVKCDAVPSCG